MKRWTRTILAILLGALAISCLVSVPADAAKTETVVTYRGYTISWSEADASNLRIVRTPGRAESFPAQANDRSIEKAKARVASASVQQIEDPTDACNFVPDTFGDADFSDACRAHDVCYSPGSPIDRMQCDLLFLQALTAECAEAYQFDFARRLTCNAVAGIYFLGVRLFGGFAYHGSGDPA